MAGEEPRRLLKPGGDCLPLQKRTEGSSATLSVAAGIFFSRLAGLLRTSALGAYFGVGPHADVFSAALRLPNLLQNLLGEQTLSAAFIPVYSRLLAAGKREEAGRLAGAVFSLLVAVAGGAAAVGVALRPADRRSSGCRLPARRELIALGQSRGRPLRARRGRGAVDLPDDRNLGALGLGPGGAQQSREVLSRVFLSGFLERRDHRGCCLDGVSERRR